MEKIFCIHCDKENEYYTKEVTKTIMVRGEPCKVEIKKCFCCECNSNVFVYSVERENQKIIFDAYKRKKGLMTGQEIINLRKKYGLTQTQLAKLIYCGEKNIARYENGAIQEKSINLLLKLVDSNPEQFGLSNKNEIKQTSFFYYSLETEYKEGITILCKEINSVEVKKENTSKYKIHNETNERYSSKGGKLLTC